MMEEWKFFRILGAKEWIRNRWETRWVHKVIKLVPGELQFWIMINAAVRGRNGGPADSFGYKEMHDVMVKDRWFR